MFRAAPGPLCSAVDGVLLESSGRLLISSTLKNFHLLTILVVTAKDLGIYTCSVCNALGTAATTAVLRQAGVCTSPAPLSGTRKRDHARPSPPPRGFQWLLDPWPGRQRELALRWASSEGHPLPGEVVGPCTREHWKSMGTGEGGLGSRGSELHGWPLGAQLRTLWALQSGPHPPRAQTSGRCMQMGCCWSGSQWNPMAP